MNRHADTIELARPRQHDAMQRLRQAAQEASVSRPVIPTVADSEPEPLVAELSADEILHALHAERDNARLELLYSPSVSGETRMRLANRLGEIDLSAAAATGEIKRLHGELAACRTSCDHELDLDLAELHHRFTRLRELCLRHRALVRRG